MIISFIFNSMFWGHTQLCSGATPGSVFWICPKKYSGDQGLPRIESRISNKRSVYHWTTSLALLLAVFLIFLFVSGPLLAWFMVYFYAQESLLILPGGQYAVLGMEHRSVMSKALLIYYLYRSSHCSLNWLFSHNKLLWVFFICPIYSVKLSHSCKLDIKNPLLMDYCWYHLYTSHCLIYFVLLHLVKILV